MTTIKPYLSICLVGLVWFARYCGKMYSRHLFSYGGFKNVVDFTVLLRNVPLKFFIVKFFPKSLLFRVFQ